MDEGILKEEILVSAGLVTTSNALEVLAKYCNSLPWENLVGVCIDGARTFPR